MAKVLFMQNCFVPDDNQFNRLKRSIESLRDWAIELPPSPNTYVYVLGGYIAEKYKHDIMELVKTLHRPNKTRDAYMFHKAWSMLFETNQGKGRVCNYCVDRMKEEEYDYIFFFDNDIVFKPDGGDIPQILIEQMDEMNAISKDLCYPVMSCNFAEHQVHALGALDFGYKTKHGLIKTSTGNYGCIGGGCWLVKMSHWNEVGGYTTDAIYGKDDGWFYLATIKMKVSPRRAVALSHDVYVIHPSDVDQAYNIFKADTNVNRTRTMSYEELQKDMDNFWKDRQ